MLEQLMLAFDSTKISLSVLSASLLTLWDGPALYFGYPTFNKQIGFKDGVLKEDIALQLQGQSNRFEVVGRVSHIFPAVICYLA